MSTKARKARKRARIKFEHTPKTPTPVRERSFFALPVPGAAGTKSIDRALEHRTVT